ncbi:acylneuraminate cytidylyltransferase family protein [Marinobacter sp. S0848L]|uniref:acylneuraminate cytidylyltransferase family protein n=1 Tax=Marinobacter sp. S0848L TaxID=2926423 RepID=UPI001FF2719D|nr:acylneuraminate cytidylyltransferase family protein [Marinobacter sp. S0848L]MCK0107313.1 acylneuraminate cytidylyltransferase family protein [Marinobacter sp. S0848L]
MIQLADILIVIPARGGSKRLPRKNILPLSGKPLICWTIEAALAAGTNSRVMVTSDDQETLNIVKNYESKGVIAHKRPDALATDTATTVDTLIDAVNAEVDAGYTPRTVILLQPTSPLRLASDINEALIVYSENKCQDTVVSVCELEHPNAWVGVLENGNVIRGLDVSGKRSQDYRKEYRLNGAIYIIPVGCLLSRKKIFTNTIRASIMPIKRSIDIDEEFDFQLCEMSL